MEVKCAAATRDFATASCPFAAAVHRFATATHHFTTTTHHFAAAADAFSASPSFRASAIHKKCTGSGRCILILMNDSAPVFREPGDGGFVFLRKLFHNLRDGFAFCDVCDALSG